MLSYSGVVSLNLLCCCTRAAKNGTHFQLWMPLHTSPARMYQRHSWSKEEDTILLRLVNEKGNAWTEIAKTLGIQGSTLKVKRRWESLQIKYKRGWTKGEDTDLELAVNKYISGGGSIGDRGSWIAIANMLKSRRTPRQCYSRWNRTLLPYQGSAVEFTRFENVRGWKWNDDEVDRLLTAVSSITSIEGPSTDIKRTERDEPWLMLASHKADAQRTPQYWVYVASKVGTRSACQCMRRWNAMAGSKPSFNVSIDELKHLIKLVEQHGTRWTFIKNEHFPNKKPSDLHYSYIRWKYAARVLGVGFLDIDPFAMLENIKRERTQRRKGADRNHDPPNGEPTKLVAIRGLPSILTPYYLAFRNQPGAIRERSRSNRGRSDTYMKFKQASPDVIDKLFEAVTQHKNDWVSISRNVGIPIRNCRQYAELLGESMVSIREAINDAEINELSRKASHSRSHSGE